ncbi:hypothetical protein F1188_16165 [Roseospira marina]|uniref:Uncharacterized protein n=1 Tax=Roseospira marina TaxID=140057 RepID=A0A5M6I7Z4_9PROT|nr:hypothetical protein [Roseospira marina]KAA5604394.1 hypothetical protein F1188_16165 [Roseospira marina]MBB4315416.1 hypothetical protein [Roseospira marina]MBB5088439.1 hypothetical protein [Roseospira marina]
MEHPAKTMPDRIRAEEEDPVLAALRDIQNKITDQALTEPRAATLANVAIAVALDNYVMERRSRD